MAGVGIASHDRPWGIRPLVTGVASPVRPWGVRPLVTGIGFMFGRVGGSAVGYWYWVHVRPCGIRPLCAGIVFMIGRGYAAVVEWCCTLCSAVWDSAVRYWCRVHYRPWGIRPLGTGVACYDRPCGSRPSLCNGRGSNIRKYGCAGFGRSPSIQGPFRRPWPSF